MKSGRDISLGFLKWVSICQIFQVNNLTNILMLHSISDIESGIWRVLTKILWIVNGNYWLKTILITTDSVNRPKK